jgi:hypothetical protein
VAASPSGRRVAVYTGALVALTIYVFDALNTRALSQEYNVEGGKFSESPSCGKAKTPEDGEPIYGRMIRRKSRLEFLAWEECDREFVGYSVRVGDAQVLVLTLDIYMKPTDTWEVTFCHCPHRFVYELGETLSGKGEFILLWRGNRIVVPAGET